MFPVEGFLNGLLSEEFFLLEKVLYWKPTQGKFLNEGSGGINKK